LKSDWSSCWFAVNCERHKKTLIVDYFTNLWISKREFTEKHFIDWFINKYYVLWTFLPWFFLDSSSIPFFINLCQSRSEHVVARIVTQCTRLKCFVWILNALLLSLLLNLVIKWIQAMNIRITSLVEPTNNKLTLIFCVDRVWNMTIILNDSFSFLLRKQILTDCGWNKTLWSLYTKIVYYE